MSSGARTGDAPPDSKPCGPAVVVHGIRQDCNVGVWDNAFIRAEEELTSILEEDDPSEVYAHGADWGARWMGAIIGMGQAIADAIDRKAWEEWDAADREATAQCEARVEENLRREREAWRYARED